MVRSYHFSKILIISAKERKHVIVQRITQEGFPIQIYFPVPWIILKTNFNLKINFEVIAHRNPFMNWTANDL